MFKLALQKAEEPEIRLTTSVRSSKKQESSRKTSMSALLTMPKLLIVFSLVQLLSRVRLFVTPWTTARQASLFITNSRILDKPMSIESLMPSSHLILHSPRLLPSIFPNIRVFSHESALSIRWPKYWTFSFSIIPSKEIPGLISFRMDWLDRLARNSQESSPTPNFKSINSSVLSFFFYNSTFIPYMTTGKTIALTTWTFSVKWCLCFLIHCLGWS